MTGRPALDFGLNLIPDRETVSGFLQGMKARNCPVRVFHLDCFWMKQYGCSFRFDPDKFPNPKTDLTEIKADYGVKDMFMDQPIYLSVVAHFQRSGERIFH